MAGRPRKVVSISTGKIGKEKIKARLEQEKKIKVGREHLAEPPNWLSKNAKKEFNGSRGLCPKLTSIHLICSVLTSVLLLLNSFLSYPHVLRGAYPPMFEVAWVWQGCHTLLCFIV